MGSFTHPKITEERKEQKNISVYITKIAKNHQIIKSVLLRGSATNGYFDEKFSDIDLTLIIDEKHTILDIIIIKKQFNILQDKKRIPISVTFLDESQLKRDVKNGVHFHGRKAGVYSFEIADSTLLYGEDIRHLFKKCNKYSILDMYRQSCDLISHFHKDIFSIDYKKGINSSMILAKRCLNSIKLFPTNSDDIIKLFDKKISKDKAELLFKIRNLREKLIFETQDLQNIYQFLTFCRDFLYKQIPKKELENLIRRKNEKKDLIRDTTIVKNNQSDTNPSPRNRGYGGKNGKDM
ncbi:MAG: hypothetical protein AABY22_09845 [Nanoarchaeota archaeon]|mgnify:CR=1 FL=1